MPPSLALFAALLLAPLAAHTTHAETVEVVQSGKAVNLFPTDPGYVFETKDAELFLKGEGLFFSPKPSWAASSRSMPGWRLKRPTA
jgi:hypothetical protein